MKNKLILSFFILSLAISFSSCGDEIVECPESKIERIPRFFEGKRDGEFVRGPKERVGVDIRSTAGRYNLENIGYSIGLAFDDGLWVRFEIWDPRWDTEFELVSGGFGIRESGIEAYNRQKDLYYTVKNATFHIEYSRYGWIYIAIEENSFFKGILNATLININDENDIINLEDIKVYFFSGDYKGYGYDFNDEEYELYKKKNVHD